MKYPKYVGLLALAGLSLAIIGCDSRPKKPLPPIPRKPPKVEDEYTPIDRDAVNAANVPQSPANAAVSDATKASQPKAPVAPVEPVMDPAGVMPWTDADGSQLPMEYWEAQYFNAQRIGITHYRIDSEKSGLKIRMATNMQIDSGQRSLRQSIVIETHEGMDGRFDRFTETLTSGPLTSETKGAVMSKEMRLETTSSQQSARKEIEWPAGSWGPLGIHQMLLRKPMVPKEARQAKVFLPQMHQLADVTMVAGEPETTTSPDGLLADVVPIDVVMQLAKEGIRVRMWSDATGRVQKTIWPEGLNLSSFRISSETATRLRSEDEIKSFAQSRLLSDVPVGELGQAKKVLLVIASEQPDPHKLFSSDSNQLVKPKPIFETTVTLFRPDWKVSPVGIPQSPPTLKELNGTDMLPAEQGLVDSLAGSWSGPSNDPFAMAQSLLQSIHKNVRLLDFAPAIRRVPLVVQSLEGHCVEQSMLMVSLLRNRKIPARLASGVRVERGTAEKNGDAVIANLNESPTAFAYHMWVEAWLNDHWVPMDPGTGRLTDCTYVKFVDTSQEDSSPYQPVLAVLRALKPLKISQITQP